MVESAWAEDMWQFLDCQDLVHISRGQYILTKRYTSLRIKKARTATDRLTTTQKSELSGILFLK